MHDRHPQLEPDKLSMPAADALLTAATAIVLAATWTDLPENTRRRLVSDIRTIARMAGLPADNVLLTPTWLRQHVLNGSAASHGVSETRMRNIRSSLRFVLRRIGMMDAAGAPLSPAWTIALDHTKPCERPALIGVARYCSSRGIAPQCLHEVAADFLIHLTERTLTPKPRKLFGRIRIIWNRCCATIAGWPGQPISGSRRDTTYVLPLDAFPESFRQDLEAFGAGLTGTCFDVPDDDLPASVPSGWMSTGRSRQPPLRPGSVALRQSHARWAASALVASGVPTGEVTTLASLVTPVERARTILAFLYERAGRKGSAAGMHVSEVLRMIAKYRANVAEPDITRIRKWSAPVALHYEHMTAKNEARVRAAMRPYHEERLRALPEVLMTAARALLPNAPLQACSLALRATSIGLLVRRPVRLSNLVRLRLDQLQRDDPRRGRISHIAIDREETKNRRTISLPVAADTARLLEEWMTRFRPLMASPACPFVFPGHGAGSGPITPQGLRDAIKSATAQHAGATLSPHQFRHLAARAFLEEHPGEYETVRQLLGHASLATTVRAYCGIEAEGSARRFDEAILNRRRRSPRKHAKTNLHPPFHRGGKAQ